MRFLRLSLSIALAAFLAAPLSAALAQGTATVRGRVLDEQGLRWEDTRRFCYLRSALRMSQIAGSSGPSTHTENPRRARLFAKSIFSRKLRAFSRNSHS